MDTILLAGRYQIIEKLGAGGFGVTFLAKDTQTPRQPICVVKQLEPDDTSPEVLEMARRKFYQEAHTLETLGEHEHIPRLLAYFEENGEFYLVQQYIEGHTLDKEISPGKPLNEKQVIKFLSELLEILKFVHSHNVIHRDIKPQNIIRHHQNKKLFLIDFGAVKEVTNQGTVKTICIFSPGYGPQEQMDGEPEFNSDIYALGMTAFQLLTAKKPKSLRRNERDEIILPEGIEISICFAAVLNKMVRPNLKERYKSVEDAIADLKPKSTPSITLKPKLLLWFIPVIATIIVACIELINPFIRPWHYLKAGNRLLDEHLPELALEQFENTIDIKRNSAQAWKGKGDALLILGQYLRASSAYDEALKHQPEDLKTWNNMGKVRYQQKRYEEALKHYEKVLTIDPENAEAWSGKGISHMALRQPQDARESFKKAEENQRDDPRIWLEQGLAIEKLNGPEDALTHYQAALESYDDFIRKNPEDAIALTDRGFVLLKLGQYEEAIASYEKALDINNNLYDALLGKGNSHTMLGQYRDALEAFDGASEIRPQDHLVWYYRGQILAQALGNHEEALESFQQATQHSDRFHLGWLGFGLAHFELKHYNKALNAFDRAKDIEPNDPFVWVNRGLVLEQLERYPEAIDSYEKALELGDTQAEMDVERVQEKLSQRTNDN